MKIKKLQMKNGYKRFHDLTIDLGDNPKRIVALVGPNGCGKSSVLDGILYRNNAHDKIGSKETKSHTYHSMTRSPGFNYQNVSIEFTDGSFLEKRTVLQAAGTAINVRGQTCFFDRGYWCFPGGDWG